MFDPALRRRPLSTGLAALVTLSALTGCDDGADGSGGGGSASTSTTTASSSSSVSTSSTSTSGGGMCTPGAMESCYTGPAATQGVGLCKAGTRTCDADGMGFGACNGEVLPATEVCMTPADEDCDGQAQACGGWVTMFTGGDYQSVYQLAAVPPAIAGGGVIVAGAFAGDFPAAAATSKGFDDIFLARVDAQGNVMWLTTFGGSGYDGTTGLAIDPVGNVYVSGFYSAGTSIGATALPAAGAYDNFFVARFAATGSPIAAVGFPSSAVLGSVGLDGMGTVVATGAQKGVVDWGGGPLDAQAGSAVVLRLGPSLQFASAALLGALDTFQPVFGAVAVDGDVALSGSFMGTANLGAGNVTAAGFEDLFVRRIASTNTPKWGHAFGTANSENGSAIAIDGGDVVIGGFGAGVDFGGGTSGPVQGLLFAARFDATGTPLWATSFPSDLNPMSVAGITVAPNHHAFAVGNGNGNMTIGSTTIDLGTGGGARAFLAELDANGAPVGARRVTTGADYGLAHAVVVGADGKIYVGGAISGAYVDGPTRLISSTGDYDGFVYQFEP